MDINAVTQLITTVGFPIAACIALYIQSNKQNDMWRTTLEQQNALHKAEMDKVTEALNNNTAALNRLIDRSEK